MENFKIDVDADGIALVTFDVAGRSMNTLTGQVMDEIPQVVEMIVESLAGHPRGARDVGDGHAVEVLVLEQALECLPEQ